MLFLTINVFKKYIEIQFKNKDENIDKKNKKLRKPSI